MPRVKKTLEEERVENRDKEKKNQLIKLENFYVNAKLDNLDKIVEIKKQEIEGRLEKYFQATNGKEYNPYLVSNYFFKSLNPINSLEPDYSPEKLGIVWDLYMYLVEQVNMNIGLMQPTISHFCKFAGITRNTFNRYKNSGSLEMQTLMNKISDETFDSNITLAQTSHFASRPTELRVKVENEVQEKPQVKVNVNVNEEVDLEQIANRLNEISSFKNTSKTIINKNVIEVDEYEEQ